jgi:VWFA-related protein
LRDSQSASTGVVEPVVKANGAAVQAPQVFRVTSTGVLVDVSVRAGKSPVGDLTTADFEVRDNGIPQAIQSLSIGAVPLDVSLVLDTADAGAVIVSGQVLPQPQAQAVSDVREIAALLRPVDRLRVLVANVRPHEVVALGGYNAGTLTVDDLSWKAYALSHNSLTAALYDTVAAALIAPAPPDRRSLVVVLTEGIDGLSVLTSDLLLSVAKESDALMHVARHDTTCEELRARNSRTGCTDSRDLLWPAETDVIENAARATGGTARHAGATESSVNTFKQILDEFRQSYILHYQPTGVTSGGWHQITARVTRPGKYDVHARRGYFGG